MAEWWVRPGTSHSGTRNGTAYANAWGGWSEIVWGVGGVVGGDTLYVCGAHSYTSTIGTGAHTGSSTATKCVIRGDYAADPGSITFSGAFYFYMRHAWTTLRNISIVRGTSPCIVWENTSTNSDLIECDFSSNGTAANTKLVHIYSTDGQTHTNLLIEGCAFHDHAQAAVTGAGGGIEWYITPTNQTSVINGLTVRGNSFSNMGTARAVIGLRAEDDTNTATRITGLIIEDNTFSNVTGHLIEVGVDHLTVAQCGDVYVGNNVASGTNEATGAIGGFIVLRSWASAVVEENTATNIAGPGGFCNLFYCNAPIVRNNTVDGVTTSTIDGNGILFDHGNVGGSAYGNRFKNLYGKDGIPYSGVGIMLLDSTNVAAFGNIVESARTGIHVGNSVSGQSGTIACNTFFDIAEYAIHTTATASSLNSVSVKNNIFVGDGYSVFDQSGLSWSAENYNCFYGFASGTSNHTLGANSSTADPLLDSSYRPLPGSPCIGAGVYIPGAKHMGGMPMNASSPDIGAYRYHPQRRLALARITF